MIPSGLAMAPAHQSIEIKSLARSSATGKGLDLDGLVRRMPLES